jgi:HSP20 family protein
VTWIARRTPFRELDTIERRLRRVLQDVGLVSALLPAADAYESADEFVVEFEVPGFDEKELSVEVSDRVLKVSGERTETTAAGANFRLRERLDRRFERRVDLPRDADTAHVKAVFEKGVLKVHVPKRRRTTPHKVAISKPGRAPSDKPDPRGASG